MNNKYTMKELPVMDKPYEKCMAYGAEMLTDAELLSVILRTGASQADHSGFNETQWGWESEGSADSVYAGAVQEACQAESGKGAAF